MHPDFAYRQDSPVSPIVNPLRLLSCGKTIRCCLTKNGYESAPWSRLQYVQSSITLYDDTFFPGKSLLAKYYNSGINFKILLKTVNLFPFPCILKIKGKENLSHIFEDIQQLENMCSALIK